jgi:hypothetical protein
MAASQTHIANIALQKLGEGTILNLTDDEHKARELNRAFAAVRDAELNRHLWRFSFARESLPALSQEPVGDEYERQFLLPNDFIRLVPGLDITSLVDLSDYRGASGTALYSIEGRNLLTNLSAPLKIRYVRRVTDTTLYTPSFDAAFASRLAYECCERITGSTEKQDRCMRDYKTAIREAITAQALELATESQGDDTWMIARGQ